MRAWLRAGLPTGEVPDGRATMSHCDRARPPSSLEVFAVKNVAISGDLYRNWAAHTDPSAGIVLTQTIQENNEPFRVTGRRI